jgi:polyisoprenoid-binding protein YceI
MGMHFPGKITLQPPVSAVELRTYGFGLIPFDGKFTRFHGSMRYDPATTGVGEIMLRIEAASLVMSNESIGDLLRGSGMIDVAEFPELTFCGNGQGKQFVGELTVNGETRALSLDYERSAGTVTATGRVRREDWGITGGQLIGGSIIRVRVVLPDPFAVPPV